MQTLVQYLKDHTDRQLLVTGAYGNGEQASGQAADLGLARAEDIKNRLVALGLPATRIETASRVEPTYTAQTDTVMDCVSMGLQVTQAVEQKLLVESRTLYFNSGKSALNITPELEKYFGDVKTYLQQNPNSKVVLTGHTDSRGEPQPNERLGLNRAERTRTELVKIGIEAKRVQVLSKGESEPVANNINEAGRSKNRRTEIILTK